MSAENLPDKPPVFQIDLKQIIRSRPEWYIRYMPGFIIALLKKLIREKELNKALRRIGHLKNYDFIEAAIRELDLKIKAYGVENIPRHNDLIFVGNHALGGADFFALMHVLKDMFPRVNHLANDILMNFEQLKDFFIPVNVFGKNPEKYRKILNERLKKSNAPVSIFPAGEVARYHKGKWDDGIWRSGFVRFAREFNKTIVPFFIPTKNSKTFYRIHALRKMLGIRANLELFLLPSELLKMKGKTVEIIFGKPIPPTFFQNDKNPHDLSEIVKQKAYTLNKAR